MWEYVPDVEHHLRNLVIQLRKDKLSPRLEFSVIGMGGRTGILKTEDIMKGRSGRLARTLPICNLNIALRLVVKALTGRVTNYQGKGEVFVILGNSPGRSKWQEHTQQLDELGVNVTPIAFAFMSRSLTEDLLRKLKTGTGKLIRLADNVSDDKLQWLFLEAIVSQIKETLATPQVPVETKPPADSAQMKAAKAAAREQPEGRAIASPPSPERSSADQPARRIQVKLTGKSPSPVDAGSSEPTKEVSGPGAVKWAEPRPEAAAPQTPRSPVADGRGIARNWQVLEPTDPADPVSHEVVDKKDTAGGWRIVGASRRGKMHAHKGIYREDAFALGEVDGWHLMVVADGGGSCPLSRVGSQLAANTAVETMAQFIKSAGEATLPVQEVCEKALRKGLEEAWKVMAAEANDRRVPLEHLGTTFLGVIHHPIGEGSVVGVAQVGDGLVAAELASGEVIPLAEPDVGETAGVTLFLTSKHWKEWLDRVNVKILETSPRLLTAMCDGVADDYIPFQEHLPELFETLRQEVLSEPEQPEQALLEFLSYDKRGSFDDRTVVLLYRVDPTPLQSSVEH